MSGIPAGAGQLLGKRLGKFEILALLALGGTAEIYLARIGGAAGFEKYVVVKCLHDHLADDAEFVKMFLDEARLAAHLDHSNIVQTMELGQHEGRYYMVMEFLAGLSLAMIIRRVTERLPTTRIPQPLVLNVLAQSCAGLHYAHEKSMNGRALNIVHRDISPQNLVISFEGVVKVVDFGIAKAEMRETHTRSGTIKGKFAYMSPEQCVANNVDRRTDVFALGVIGYELLTGKRLFKRPSPYETYQAVIECEVRPPSEIEREIDPALDAVLMRSLTKDKADRYPTAEAFGDALLGYLHHRGIGSGPGDVSRFFDAHFGQELEEHSSRMRELISGREIAMETGVSWGGDEAEEALALPDESGERGRTNDGTDGTDDDGDGGQRQPGALSLLLDDLGSGSRGEDDDEMPAERTRIESNPLERINELDKVALNKPPKAKRSKRSAAAGSAPPPAANARPTPLPSLSPPARSTPLPPLSSTARSSSPSVRPSAPLAPARPSPSPAGAVPAAMAHLPSGAFPDLSNMPTMISPSELAAELATTTEGTPLADNGFSNAPTNIAMPAMPDVPAAVSSFANAPTGLAPSPSHIPPAASAFANAPTALAVATQIAPPNAGTAPPINGAGQVGWPGQAGAGRPHAQPQPRAAQPMLSPPVQLPPGYPVMNAQMSAQIASGAAVFPSGSRAPEGDAFSSDPQRAAQVMSPVGDQFSEQVDWGAAAATRARAVPPWLLVILFVAALGVALGLTIAISRIVR